MKITTTYLLILLSLIAVFTTCKKYPEGGLTRQTCKHLFGGTKNGSSKTWKLKKYEVNGIDSTYLILGTTTIPDFYDKFITFTLTDSKDERYKANTYIFDYFGGLGLAYKEITVGIPHIPITKQDSLQCKAIDGTLYCSRNLLFPEFNGYSKLWNIKKLTRKEFIIETSKRLKNSYKIILTQ